MTSPKWSWKEAEFTVNGITPSKNTTNWKSMKGKMASKIKWREIFLEELRPLYLPTPLPIIPGTPLIIAVTLRFTDKSRNPEVINYEPAIKEILADTLRRSEDASLTGWIDDDKDHQIKISVAIMPERCVRTEDRGMRVQLKWMEWVEDEATQPFFENSVAS